jgi:hypothetical protein
MMGSNENARLEITIVVTLFCCFLSETDDVSRARSCLGVRSDNIIRHFRLALFVTDRFRGHCRFLRRYPCSLCLHMRAHANCYGYCGYSTRARHEVMCDTRYVASVSR